MKVFLEGDGYEKIEAENAEDETHTGITIHYKEGFKSSANEISEALLKE